MPTTRAARRAARCLTEVLPADALGLVLYQLTLAHDIAAVAPTCHTLCDATKLAMKLRPFSSEVVTLGGHTEQVYAVAAAPDGRIITAADDGYLRVWADGTGDANEEDYQLTLAGHINAREENAEAYINAVTLLPDGRLLSAAEDSNMKLWAADGSLERICDLQIVADMDQVVICLVTAPDGVHFVAGLGGGPNKGEVRLYHVDGTLVHIFKGHVDLVWMLAVTPDGQHIISGSEDKLVKVWSVASKSLVSTCAGHSDCVDAVAVMPDGQRILSASWDMTVRVWLLNGTHQNTFRLHTGTVKALVALPDNQHALSSSYDRTVKLFNVNDGAVLRTFTHPSHMVLCLALTPDGRRFVSGAGDLTARIFEIGLAPQ